MNKKEDNIYLQNLQGVFTLAAIPELSHHINTLLEIEELEQLINNIPDNILFSQIRDDLITIRKSFEDLADEIPEIAAELFVGIAKDQITSLSTGNGTGMMAGSIDTMPDGERNFLIMETAESPDGFPYPLAFETGRREVVPVEAKVLRWWEGGFGGTPIFAMRSRATHPRPFWANTEAAMEYVAQYLPAEEAAKKGI